MNARASLFLGLAVLALSAAASVAQPLHTHFAIDTESGTPGDQTLIRTGYYPGEEDFRIDGDGRVWYGDVYAQYLLNVSIPFDPFDGWIGGGGVVLASDEYFDTGRLEGGDFWYEIIDFVPVSGSAQAAMSWAIYHDGELRNIAVSNGETRLDRSFHVGAGLHEHGQLAMVSHLGIYDLTIQAWDENGVYTDSSPVTMRFEAVPAPGAAGLLLLAGAAAGGRRRR